MKRFFVVLITLMALSTIVYANTAGASSPPGIVQSCPSMENFEFVPFQPVGLCYQNYFSVAVLQENYVKRSNRGAIIFSFAAGYSSYYEKPGMFKPLRC